MSAILKPRWTQTEAVKLCRTLESIAPACGAHVALTGGCLYKDGPRKDCDILLYRIRQVQNIDTSRLFAALADVGVIVTRDCGWCVKAMYGELQVDLFFPERLASEQEYPTSE